jgi:ribulose-5-phosphate 4-epimerase/fuculose-1-phosphate aldolase
MRSLLIAVALAAVVTTGVDLGAQGPPQPNALDNAGVVGVIDDLVAANRILVKQGVLDGMGHVSVRHPQRPDRFLLARSIAPAQVTAADVLEYDLDSNAVDARGRASYRERFIHGEIYRLRPDVQAIVHCHTPSLIPFAATDVPLRAMYHMAAFVADGVPLFDIRKTAGMTDLLVGDATLGRALAQALGSKAAVLMRHHGAVVVATSIPNVVGRSVYLDMNARIQVQAMTLGGTITSIDPAEAKLRMTDPNEYSRAWDLWKLEAR